MPRGSVSPQLGRLESIGLVEKTPIFPGKKTGYQIAERFFNIWYLMRFASRRQRTALVCLTRFLEGFYTPPELEPRARRVLTERNASQELRDTQALHQALFAAYEADWNSVRRALLSALAEITDRLPPLTRDDWCRASAVLVHLGFGPRLVELLIEQGADVRLMPWFAAVEAHVLGDQRYLQNIPAEVRQVASELYTAIDRYRCQLPAN